MINIEEKDYVGISQKLIESLTADKDLFNGSVEYDTDAFCSTLKCTLIITHKNIEDHTGNISIITNIVPVWWEFITAQDGIVCNNDFSWREFITFFNF